MSITKQTCCPHCSSVFNITDEQLAARGGHVRCGGCLQVFRADQHLVTDTSAATPAVAVPTTGVPVVARTQSSNSQPATKTAPDNKKRKNPDDESWAFNLMDGDGDADDKDDDQPVTKVAPAAEKPPVAEAAPVKKPMFDDEISDMLQDAWMDPMMEKNHLKGVGTVDKIKESADESWAKALITELEEEEKKEQAKTYSMEMQSKKAKEPPRKALSPKEKDDDNTNRPVQNPAPAPKTTNKEPAAPANKEDDLLNFLNSNSAPTINQRNANLPLEINNGSMTSVNWGYWITWFLLCGAAFVLLISQYAYFHFDELSIAKGTRPAMVQLCSVLRCKPPEPPDINQLTVSKLVIQPHPTTIGALRVNAIIYNKADFAQPLPALKLSFMNRQHKVTAARVFQSADYLQGDAGHLLRRIPPETPIHIQLDIVDPKVDMASSKMQPLF